MNEAKDLLLTKIFLLIGSAGGVGVMTLNDIDLISGIILKWVTIVSFVIVIFINIDKLIETIKMWFRKKNNP